MTTSTESDTAFDFHSLLQKEQNQSLKKPRLIKKIHLPYRDGWEKDWGHVHVVG